MNSSSKQRKQPKSLMKDGIKYTREPNFGKYEARNGDILEDAVALALIDEYYNENSSSEDSSSYSGNNYGGVSPAPDFSDNYSPDSSDNGGGDSCDGGGAGD